MVKVSESKKEAFRRLAEQRTNAVLERLRILGRCANLELYEYSQEDVEKVFQAIEKELRATKLKFQNSEKPQF